MAESTSRVQTEDPNTDDLKNQSPQMSSPTSPTDKLPTGSYFCISQIVLHSFALLGTRVVMPLYLRNKLGYSNNEATAIVHGMDLMKFFTPIGAIIADSFWNRYGIIIVCLILSASSRLLLFLGSIPLITTQIKYERIFMYSHYILLGISMNGLETSVMSFRGDQFKLPEQQATFRRYVHIQYFLHNISVFLSYLMNPLLKTEIHCLGEQDCYCAAFGISIIFILLSASVFAAGYKYYVIKKPAGNMMVLVSRCIGEALRQKRKEGNSNPKQHWLDYAEPKYGFQLVEDLKRMFSLMKIFATIPIFFSLYTQYMTKWLFQASRMDGRIGSYTIVPDHYQLLNPVIILMVMPLSVKYIDPRIKRWHMDRSLRRMMFGGLVAALSFVLAGFLEISLRKTGPVLPGRGMGQLRIINGLPCDCLIKSEDFDGFPIVEVRGLSAYSNKHLEVLGQQNFTVSGTCPCAIFPKTTTFLVERRVVTLVISKTNDDVVVKSYQEKMRKYGRSNTFLTVHGVELKKIILQDSKGINITVEDNSEEIAPEWYSLFVDGRKIGEFQLLLGGAYVFLVHNEETLIEFVVTQPNSIHMFWIIPQSFILCVAEIYFLLTLTEFTYTQAPDSMKTIISSMRVIALALGHTLVIIFTLLLRLREDIKYFVFAGLMTADVVVLSFVGRRFKSINPDIKLI